MATSNDEQLQFAFLEKAPTQAARLYLLLQDHQPHRTDEIVTRVYASRMSLSRVAARIYDIKRTHGLKIDGWHDPDNPALYWYQLKGKASDIAPEPPEAL
jgi:hypothetical protein